MGVYWAEIADHNPTQRQIEFIKNIVKPTGLVLDLACGTGRHIIPLNKEGYEVVGLDLSRSLLKIAKNRLRSDQLVRGDMRRLPFIPEVFAAAVSMDTSFGYLPTQQEDMQSLRELRKTLRQDGLLIIDVFNREHLTRKYKADRRFKLVLLPLLLKLGFSGKWLLSRFYKWREYPSFYLLQKRTIDTNGEKLSDMWIVRDKVNGEIIVFKHVVRLYQLHGLEEALNEADFAVKRVLGGYEGQPLSHDSDRLILIASAEGSLHCQG